MSKIVDYGGIRFRMFGRLTAERIHRSFLANMRDRARAEAVKAIQRKNGNTYIPVNKKRAISDIERSIGKALRKKEKPKPGSRLSMLLRSLGERIVFYAKTNHPYTNRTTALQQSTRYSVKKSGSGGNPELSILAGGKGFNVTTPDGKPIWKFVDYALEIENAPGKWVISGAVIALMHEVRKALGAAFAQHVQFHVDNTIGYAWTATGSKFSKSITPVAGFGSAMTQKLESLGQSRIDSAPDEYDDFEFEDI